jgi:adenylate cyclase
MHDGRIVNTWGDAIIIEFSSVTEAVMCATAIQTELGHRNAELPDGERMSFRVGINLGDIMIEGDDIYGDGVNVAARLQEVAEPGGIVISGSVYDQVRQKLALGFHSLGLQQVKNIAEPVRSFRIRIGGRNAEEPDPPSDKDDLHRPPSQSGGQQADAARPFADAIHSSLAAFTDWYRSRPNYVRVSAVAIFFFFLINMMGSPTSFWFQWPSIPFIVVIVLSEVLRVRAK